MKPELLKKRHMRLLKQNIEELYSNKYPWADDTLFETLVNDRVKKVIDEMNEEDYLKDLEDEED